MADYDITLKRLSDLYPEDFARLLIPGEAIADASHIEDREINLLLRKVDYLYRVDAKDGREYIIHIEFQVEHKTDIPRRMFEYAGQITSKYHLPVVSGVIYLKEVCRDIPDSYNIVIGGRLVNSFKYRVIKLWEMDAGDVTSRGIVGLMPLVPLMKVGETEGVLKNVYEGLLRVSDKEECRELIAGAYILSGLKYDIGLIKRIFLKEAIVMESVTYQEILERGIERGIEKGIERGIEKGIERGIERGIGEGKIEEGRLLLMRQIERKWGRLPVEIRERIERISRVEELESLGEKLIVCDRLEELFESDK